MQTEHAAREQPPSVADDERRLLRRRSAEPPPPAFLGACTKHFGEPAVSVCEDCGQGFCGQCLVPPTRKRQPLRCIDCALVAAGVRAPGPRHAGMQNVTRAQKRPNRGWL